MNKYTDKFGSINRVAAVLMILLLIMSGCGSTKGEDNTPGTENGSGSSTGSAVTDDKTDTNDKDYVDGALTYLVENNITIENVEQKRLPTDAKTGEVIKNKGGFEYSENCVCSYSPLVISGMKDKDVQKKINDRIEEATADLEVRELPAYRGIKRKLPEGSVITQIDTYASQNGNYNNILSMSIDRTLRFATPDKDGNIISEDPYSSDSFVSETVPLTFDLNTGDELSLSDLFKRGSDYKKVIDTYISEQINEPAEQISDDDYSEIYTFSISPTGKFTGIKDNQKYLFGSWGIQILLDQDTPEFDTGMGYTTLAIPLGKFKDMFAIEDKYYDKNKSLYENEEKISKILVSNYGINDVIKKDSREVPIVTEGSENATMYVESTMQYPSSMNKKIIEDILSMSSLNEQKIEDLKEQTAMGTYGEQSYYYVNTSAQRFGNYYSVQNNEYMSGEDDSSYSNNYYNYNAETGEKLELKDVFVEGFDYESEIKKLLFKDDESIDDIYKTEESRALILQNINNFSISSDGLSIFFDSTDLPESADTYKPDYTYVYYADLGCDNLTLFS